MLESLVWSIFEHLAAKYIKGFRPEELKISLWEGEVTMQNVELNTEVGRVASERFARQIR